MICSALSWIFSVADILIFYLFSPWGKGEIEDGLFDDDGVSKSEVQLY